MTRVQIIESEKFGLSPAEKNFSLQIFGQPTAAILVVEFTESFGYKLKEVFLNGTRIQPQSGSTLKADVRFLVKDGNNKLTVVFDALQFLGNPLGATTISAFIDVQGATVVEIPSAKQTAKDFFDFLNENKAAILTLVVGLAVLGGSVAFLSSRLPSFGGIKVNKLPTPEGIVKKVQGIASEAQSDLKHVIATVKEKV